jgi:hypothetical protein
MHHKLIVFKTRLDNIIKLGLRHADTSICGAWFFTAVQW